MRIIGKTDIGCNRTENQDTYRCGEVPGVAGWGLVCDGMGGAQNGRLASAVAADCIEEMLFRQIREAGDAPDFSAIQADAIHLANAEVFARSCSGESMMGTTVVCAVIAAGRLFLAHVGDSRAYLLENGKMRQVTHDHSMVQELVDMGTITQEEASRHPERNVITRALGVDETVEPTYGVLDIAPDGIVLLCSDGLTNLVPDAAIAKMLAEEDFYDLPRLLVQKALDAGGDDNITVMVMQPGKSGD